ncbi:hypothetical protein LINPERPRIM_LOCUS31782 [Linum perenne]
MWTNYQTDIGKTRSRLDRGLANTTWRIEFDQASIPHESIIGSDHGPLILNTNPTQHHNLPPFRFNTRWLSIPTPGHLTSQPRKRWRDAR